MKKRLILTTLIMLFAVTIPTKADFWKKLKNAITGTGSSNSSSSSNSSGKSGGTRGYLKTDGGDAKIINPSYYKK